MFSGVYTIKSVNLYTKMDTYQDKYLGNVDFYDKYNRSILERRDYSLNPPREKNGHSRVCPILRLWTLHKGNVT